MDRYAVIGNPIAHSKSPFIHAAFARQTGQAMQYDTLLAPLDGFHAAVRAFALAGGRGLNVTVPFKLEAWKLADRRSPRAALAGAANTLCLDGPDLYADNTDGAGLVRDLGGNLGRPLTGVRILLLGAGGASRGVLLPLLAERPAQLFIANRTAARGAELAQHFQEHAGATVLAGGGFDDVQGTWDVVINATSASLADEAPPLAPRVWATDALAYDMMYGAAPTAFLRAAQALGVSHRADGLGMLVEQAAESFALWRGVRPDTAPVLAELRARLSA